MTHLSKDKEDRVEKELVVLVTVLSDMFGVATRRVRKFGPEVSD